VPALPAVELLLPDAEPLLHVGQLYVLLENGDDEDDENELRLFPHVGQ
jgi:hypothetical protein